MLAWLCDSLDLPHLTETEGGGVFANAAAREALGANHPASLVEALGHLVNGAPSAAELEEGIRRARQGARLSMSVRSGHRVLFAPAAPGRASAVVAPAQLASLQQRAAATERTAGVSHELANALGAIAGWARLAQQGTRVEEALHLIERSAENAWSAARQMLVDVSHAESVELDTVDLSAFVDEAARLLTPKALRRQVTVTTSIAPELHVRGQRGDVWSVIWNLATNAVEALPHGGNVQLELAPTDNRVSLQVRDDGPGMPAEVRSRIFEPYFTTKRSGSGLGLAMVKRAVETMGGELRLQSAPGKGTCFTVELPMATPQSEERLRREQKKGKRSSGVFLAEHLEGRVLVVDDDEGLREMVATALGMRGAEVVAVSSPAEALQLEGPFELAVIDLLLPDQRGDRLLAQLRHRRMVDHALLVTGTELPADLDGQGEPDGVLRKPFELEDLFERVADIIGNVGGSSAVG